ncbi:MAG TPA: GNAT family N-acetyltransferase [Stellaceae bacterium]|jgi:ribosomal protein S18 acetylase RimI-like enzyme|nr:GNAT family N-acetyltransferase [Stellaceae bacterium]
MATGSDITVRTARLDDAAPIGGLDVETWQAAYAGILGTPYLAGLSAARREAGWSHVIRRDPASVYVAIAADGAIVGFGSCGAARGEPSFTGEVFTLYVAPDWQNQGIGRRLLLAMFARLAAQGHKSAVIWVLRENSARFFYQRLGGREMRHKQLPFNGSEVAAAGYGWSDLPGYLAAHTAADREPKA